MVKGINYILVNDATVGSLVGANAAGDTKKVYPVIGTQKEQFPFVTVWETSRVPDECKGQRATSFSYTYEVHVYAKDYDEVNDISEAVADALEDAVLTSPINGVVFSDRIRNTNRRDGGYIEDYKVYNKVLTFESRAYEDQAT